MSLSIKDVEKIARLARIKVTEDDKEHYAREISGILKWIEQLNEINTDNVPAMTSVAAMQLPCREDKITDGGIQESIIKNAPESDYGCFVVPKVLE